MRQCPKTSLVLCTFAVWILVVSTSSAQGQTQFPGEFFVVDHAALYDGSIENELVNGDFELSQLEDVPGWQLVLESGTPSAEVVPGGSDEGQMLQVTTNVDDSLYIRSEPTAVVADAERYVLAFKVSTDFAVIDEFWGGALKVTANLRWYVNGVWKTDPSAQIRVRHSLRAWRPMLTEVAVPAGAEAVQVQFQVSGNVPNADVNGGDAPHTTYFDEVRLLAAAEDAPSPLAPMPVVGETAIQASAEALSFLGLTADGSYQVSATFQPDSSGINGGEVWGELTNLTERNAAVDLIFAVDLDATGGRISYDISRGELIDDTNQPYYEDPISADWYSTLTMSAVPLGSVTNTSATSGMAVPLDAVRIFQFRYNNLRKRMETLYRFGLLASDADRSSASFRVYLMVTDTSCCQASVTAARLGYRELWQQYVSEVEPQSFLSPNQRPAAPRAMGTHFDALFSAPDLDPRVPDLQGLIANWGIEFVQKRFPVELAQNRQLRAQLFRLLDQYNLELVNYDYRWILEQQAYHGSVQDQPVEGWENTEVPPSYAEIEQIRWDLTGSDLDCLSLADSADILRCIKADEVLRDPRMDLLINRVYSPDFAFGNWLLRLPVETRPYDPNTSVGSVYLDQILALVYLPAFQAGASAVSSRLTDRQRVTGLILDGFMKESKVLDCRSKEMLVSNSPLTYDPNTGQPCAHNHDANLAYLAALRSSLDNEGHIDKRIAANLTQLGPAIFGLPFLDHGVWEALPQSQSGGTNFGHRHLNTRRMMMPDKPLGVIDKTEWCTQMDHTTRLSHIRGLIETIAILGLYPNLLDFIDPPACLADIDPSSPDLPSAENQAVRDLVAEVVPVLDAMNYAGWQILPSATIESVLDGAGIEELRAEQFGAASPYYFAVLNNPSGLLGDPDALPQNARLVVDLEALGLCGRAFDIGVAYGDINPQVSVEGCELYLQFSLLAEQGAVFKVFAEEDAS